MNILALGKSYFISNIIVEKMVQHLQDVIISERLVRFFFFFFFFRIFFFSEILMIKFMNNMYEH